MNNLALSYKSETIFGSAAVVDDSNLISKVDIDNSLAGIFNKKVVLNNQFKHKIDNIINLIEFTYPEDRKILNSTITAFVESSHRILEDYIETTNNTESIHYNESGSSSSKCAIAAKVNCPFELINLQLNDYWMKDWLEQIELLDVNHEKQIESKVEIDDYYYYEDVTNTF